MLMSCEATIWIFDDQVVCHTQTACADLAGQDDYINLGLWIAVAQSFDFGKYVSAQKVHIFMDYITL